MFDLAIDNLSNFFDRGGFVLYIVFITAFALWALLLERFLYIHFEYKKYREKLFLEVKSLKVEQKFKESVKNYFTEETKVNLQKNLRFIKLLIIVCPLIGLLGTVTGMIEVFDVMAILGTSNAKSMASGVSMATIPTMAGMVVALSGILFEKRLDATINFQVEKTYLDISKVLS